MGVNSGTRQPELVITRHHPYRRDNSLFAVEFRPPRGELRNWAIAWPQEGPQPATLGVGPARGGSVTSMLTQWHSGRASAIDGAAPALYSGACDPITPSTAAYVVFRDAHPDCVAFGVADAPLTVPANWQLLKW